MNLFAANGIAFVILDIEHSMKTNRGSQFYLHTTVSGHQFFKHKDNVGEEIASGSLIPTTHSEHYTKFILDVAESDENLFVHTQRAYDSVQELEHIRASLIQQLSGDASKDFISTLSPFVDYAKKVLHDVGDTIEAVYTVCSNQKIAIKRVI